MCILFILTESWLVTINVDIDEIVKIAIKFSDILPVIFCYISAEAAERIRNMLHMEDSNELGFDPDSKGFYKRSFK